MKKYFIVLIILCGSILALWIAGRVTGALQFYNIPTIANEPTIKAGDKIFATNLKELHPYQFIVFASNYADSLNTLYMNESKPASNYLFRLCGISGDIIEMKNGILFVNNKNFDNQLDLKNQFKVVQKDFYVIEQEDIYDNDTNDQIIRTGDSVIVTFDNLLLKKYQSKITLIPYIINDTSNLSGCFKWLDKHSTWTTDNFGPLKIPSNGYFVLGDNRHNAMDSRYFGFVIKDDIKGVVLGK